MPTFYEVNTKNEVLCYLPSGKVSDTDQQETQFAQDGGTCWFYSTKRLAKATGHRLDTPNLSQRYELISTFRKTQSRLEAAILIAATLLAENCPTERINARCTELLLSQRVFIASYRFSPWLTQNVMRYFRPGQEYRLLRQLKSITDDTQIIRDYIERYRMYHPGVALENNPDTIQAIVCWLEARNPYQSQLLECACNTADGLTQLGSSEFPNQEWSQEQRPLIHVANIPTGPDLLFTERPEVIVLGSRPEHTQASQQELTVQEKQARRAAALIQFNRKIYRETLTVFKMNTTAFSTPEELMARLKNEGPLLLNGFYGKQYYKVPPHALRNADGTVQLFGTRQLIGWNKGEAKEHNSLAQNEHVITIIGIKYNPENPRRSHVIFMDSNDASFPGEQRTAYVMSFERLQQNKTSQLGDLLIAHYSTSNNASQSAYERDVRREKSNLLMYSTFATVAAAGVGYVALRALSNR